MHISSMVMRRAVLDLRVILAYSDVMGWNKGDGEDHILYCGLKTQPTIEGPKVYKRNGYYYILLRQAV